MRIDIFIIQIAVTLLPGLIWAQLVATYAMKERPPISEFLIRSFIFGALTYSTVYLGYTVLGYEFSIPQVYESQLLQVDLVDEILWSSLTALIFSLAWNYCSSHKWMIRALNWAGMTRTHGSEDIWNLTFSFFGDSVEYVHLRDFEKGITYAGWVRGYSETGEIRELLLSEAQVWDEDGTKHEVPVLYISRPVSDLHVEFPHTPHS